MALATTKMSSRGQVVIPEDIRMRLKLKEGSRFVVLQHDDTVILKMISEPSREEFQQMLAKVRSQVKKAGIKKSDVEKAVEKIRRSK